MFIAMTQINTRTDDFIASYTADSIAASTKITLKSIITCGWLYLHYSGYTILLVGVGVLEKNLYIDFY